MNPTPQGGSGRADRLTRFLSSCLSGSRKIQSMNDARLFFEAVRAQSSPCSCVERLIASKNGLEALRISIRMDLSPAFINSQTLPFLMYFFDQELKLLADGRLLQQILLVVAQPLTLWNVFVSIAMSNALEGPGLRTFAWLCYELISLPKSAGIDVTTDVAAVTHGRRFLDAPCPDTRGLAYKIEHVLQLRNSPAGVYEQSYAPGGRHDNDFEDFRNISIYPTIDEFLSVEMPFYRPAKEVFDTDLTRRFATHLDNLYRLTREDLLGELRSDWKNAHVHKRKRMTALNLVGLRAEYLDLGDANRRRKCSLAVSCKSGLENIQRLSSERRKAWLSNNRNFLRHHAFGALYLGDEIFGFAFVHRDMNSLLLSTPVVILQFTDRKAFERALLVVKASPDAMFTLIDTPVFAYEPVLDRLKNMTELPLEANLLDPGRIEENIDPDIDMKSFTDLQVAPTGEGMVTVSSGHVRKDFRLDQTQVQCLRNALTSRSSVIQGPPGTGKSFIGALTAYFLLKYTNRKLLVITFTNHALDQFIEDLFSFGIRNEDIVRLGSKSTPKTSSLLLSAQRSDYHRSRESWDVVNRLKRDVDERCIELHRSFREYLHFNPSFSEIQEYLEFSEDGSRFFEAFAIPTEDDQFTRVGRHGREVSSDYLYDNWKNGRGPGLFKQSALRTHADVWNIPPPQRIEMNQRWLTTMLKDKIQRVAEHANQHDLAQETIDEIYDERKVHILRNKRIIGCTTTAAAMYTKLLTAAQVEGVIVEEAGEIQESHVLTALTPSVKQIMQIGDHKQLRPKINNFNLTVEKGGGYDLNRSLFERLILQGHQYSTLNIQHRMHPDISLLVKELTYPDLQDGPSTKSRERILGLDGRVIYVNHDQPEKFYNGLVDRRDEGAKSSKENLFEAQMVLKTVKYLAQQGYGTRQMTVLTPYLAQLRLLQDLLSQDVDPMLSDLDSFDFIRAGLVTQATATVGRSPLRISTIDNYQGEEADIVIVSLTRSNNNGDIGFLWAKERLNVLLSRARNCIIMFGNMETFMHSKRGQETWLPFFTSMKSRNNLYDGLPVKCEKHPEKKALLMKPDDFDRCCPDGGCAQPCGTKLKCGIHHCQMRCHRISDHSQMLCRYQIEVACERNHRMRVSCHESGNKCRKCIAEDMEAERRIKRDLQLEAKRQKGEEAYKRELQEIQDEIDHQRRLMKYQRDEEQQEKTLAQQRADLATLKATAEKVLNTPRPPSLAPPSSSSTEHLEPLECLEMLNEPGKEWLHLKTFEGAKSEPLDELMSMIGLEAVKSAFLEIKWKVDTALRQNIPVGRERYNCSMLGNPGTGKTTIARLYAKFLTSIGVIPGSCFREETGAALANSGVTGCKKIIEDVLNDGGGVIFIDEAYQLTSGHSNGGGAVLDYLLTEFENLMGQVVFILAGYSKQMESLFAHNPGLPSRFPIEMKFEDYSDEELLHILDLTIRKKYDGKMKFEEGPKGLFCRIVSRRVGRGRGKEGFGNARSIETAVATISRRQARRLGQQRRAGQKPDDFLLTKEDLIGPEPKQALSGSKAWLDLQKLTGLGAVKEAVKALVDTVEHNFQRELDEQQIIEYSLNRVFLGNPGTGKTTVAKLYGKILVDLGMLSKGEVFVKNPSDFTGSHLGESEKLTRGILAASMGKVLVIDEAYGLYGGQGSTGDSYKTAVIDTIVAEVQSVPGDDRCVLLLGYKEQMEEMFQNVNPGLSRRFPIASAFEFEDFDDQELYEILDLKLNQQSFHATDQAKRVAMAMLSRARNRPNFGNAGEIDILLNQAKARHQTRLRHKKTKAVSTLDAEDFDEDFDRSERSDTDVKKLFQGTVGNEDVVKLLQEYQETIKAMKSCDLDPKESIPFNFLFKGPPGTGKTTTARKMGKVFYDMGFLATAEVIECSATDLIGSYVGQTGPKVKKQLDRALGKVLFVDEAYRLAEGHFAKEAVDELVDATTKERYAKRLVIVLAGYEADINRLTATNSGLTSRFPETINFRSLTPDECLELLLQEFKDKRAALQAKDKNLDITALEAKDDPSRARVLQLFEELSQVPDWASARDVKEVRRAVFNKTLQDKTGLSTGRLTIRMQVIEAELDRMLHERKSRQTNVKISQLSGLDLPTAFLTPPSLNPPSSMRSTAKISECQAPPAERPTDEGDVPKQNLPMDEKVCTPCDNENQRDAGVSDAVWEQLQQDRRAEEECERNHKELIQASKAATLRDEERKKILKRLLEEEEHRKKQEAAKKKLEAQGLCPVGYTWIRQASGYRCAGGSHFVSDAQLSDK